MRIHKAGNGRGFSLSEEAQSVFEAQDPNIDWAAAAVQDATQHYRVVYAEKRATTQASLYRFFKRVDRVDSARNQNLSHQHQA